MSQSAPLLGKFWTRKCNVSIVSLKQKNRQQAVFLPLDLKMENLHYGAGFHRGRYMQYVELIQFLSGVIFCAGYIPYIGGVLDTRNEKRIYPPVLAFGILFFVDALQVVSAAFSDTAYVMPLAATFGNFLVVVLAVWRRQFVLSCDKWNVATLVLSAIVLIGWLTALILGMSIAVVILGLSLLAGLLPVIPLWQVLIVRPHSQGTWPWILWPFSSLLSIGAVVMQKNVDVQQYLLPVSYFVVCLIGSLLRFRFQSVLFLRKRLA